MTTQETQRFYALFGGRAGLGEHPPASEDLVRAGLPYRAFKTFLDLAGFTTAEQVLLFGMSRSTVMRVHRSRGKLGQQETDRVVRVARVVSEALELWDDEARVNAWLRTPNQALGDHAPLELLDTDPGTRKVENVINRLKHGVFA